MNLSDTNNKTVDISIVVATYNRAEMLRNALKTLISQKTEGKFAYEICVIDDGSTDHTAAVVREMAQNNASPTIKYIYTSGAGPSHALNRGVAEARGEWLAFFDDDQLAEPEWLAELYRVAQEKGVKCVDGAVCLDLPNTNTFELLQKWRILLGEKFLGNCIRKSSKDYMGSGNLLIKKNLVTQLGGFDTVNFPLVSYDTDLFWRLEREGYYSYYTPHALVHHVIPESRLKINSLTETLQRQAVTYAKLVFKYEGALKLTLLTLWRLSIILGRDILLYSIFRFFGPKLLLIDKKMNLRWGAAFVRGALSQLMPTIFKQEKFINTLYISYLIRNG